jgi:hypothetical protein
MKTTLAAVLALFLYSDAIAQKGSFNQENKEKDLYISAALNLPYLEPSVGLHYVKRNKKDFYMEAGYAFNNMVIRSNGDGGGQFKLKKSHGEVLRAGINFYDKPFQEKGAAAVGIVYEFKHYGVKRYCWVEGSNGMSTSMRESRAEINFSHAGMMTYRGSWKLSKQIYLTLSGGLGIQLIYQDITAYSKGHYCNDLVVPEGFKKSDVILTPAFRGDVRLELWPLYQLMKKK